MSLKPVYRLLEGPALYQTGYRTLERQSLEKRVRILVERDIRLLVSVSPYRDTALELYVPFHHAPFGDNSQFAQSMDVVTAVAAHAAEVMRSNGSVLTYCFMGVNRSGFVNALIIRELERCDGPTALGLLRANRRGACKGNHHFEGYLEGLPCPD